MVQRLNASIVGDRPAEVGVSLEFSTHLFECSAWAASKADLSITVTVPPPTLGVSGRYSCRVVHAPDMSESSDPLVLRIWDRQPSNLVLAVADPHLPDITPSDAHLSRNTWSMR